MATHIAESRKAVRHYLHQQWGTMMTSLGNPKPTEDPKAGSPLEKARANFVAFEEALSFPYNQKLAYFPADNSIKETTGSGRARGEFGAGSLIPFDFGEQLAAHQSAMLASLYARQEFIRAAARMPMTLFVGPQRPNVGTTYPTAGTLLTSEKFSRAVFSGYNKKPPLEYVAVAELSRTYPQTAIVRIWWSGKETGGRNKKAVIINMKRRWTEIAGVDKDTQHRILSQRGQFAKKVIPLFTKAMEKEETSGMYIQHVDTRADMWANVIALTASDKHGDTNLSDKTDTGKLWRNVADVANSMNGWQWMAAMLALRRIPYIVKSEEADDANQDPLPHALTHAEAMTVKSMMGAIIIARQNGNPKTTKEIDVNSNFSGNQQQQRVIFAETTKWW